MVLEVLKYKIIKYKTNAIKNRFFLHSIDIAPLPFSPPRSVSERIPPEWLQDKFQKIFRSNAFKLCITVTLNKCFWCFYLLFGIPFKLKSKEFAIPIFNQINLLPVVSSPKVIVGV